MQEFPLKRRVGMFLGMMILYIPLVFGGGWLSFITLNEYLAFPPEISFSSFFVYGFSAIFILVPVAFCSLCPIFLGRRISIEIQRNLTKYMIAALIATIIFQIGFKIYFLNKLEVKGYISCPGTPSGWLSGMAKKYVLPPEKCDHQ